MHLAVANALPELEVVNIGTAGTFVVRADVADEAIRAAFARALSYDALVIVLSEVDVTAATEIASRLRLAPNARAFVRVLTDRPPTTPDVPIVRGKPWTVRIEHAADRFAVGQRHVNGRSLDRTAVVEKALDVRATTRGVDTP